MIYIFRCCTARKIIEEVIIGSSRIKQSKDVLADDEIIENLEGLLQKRNSSFFKNIQVAYTSHIE
jgi:hypothetical protein